MQKYVFRHVKCKCCTLKIHRTSMFGNIKQKLKRKNRCKEKYITVTVSTCNTENLYTYYICTILAFNNTKHV